MKKIFVFAALLIFSSLVFGETKYTLSSLNEAMNDCNPELLKLREEYSQSLLDVKDALAGFGPTIDLQITGTYLTNVPIDAVYINVDDVVGAIKWPSGTKPGATGQRIKLYDGMENTYYNFGLSFQQPIWTWGKVTNAVKLYKLISEIKLTQLESEIQKKETELEIRLITLSYLSRIMDILEEEKAYATRLVKVSEDAEKSGMLLHQDVIEAKIQAKELEIVQNDILDQINNQLMELRRITGKEDIELSNLDYQIDENVFTSILAENREETEALVLSENQLSLKMLNKLKEVNAVALKIAKGFENWKPDVGLQITAGYGGSRLPFTEPNWLRKDDWSANISIGIKTTVWDGGKKLNDVARKKSAQKVADIQKLDATSTLKQTFNNQWNTAEVCSIKVEYQDLKIETQDSKIKQKQTVYESGYGSETDVLSAKIERCNEQIEKERQLLGRAIACMTIKSLRGN